MFNNLIAGLMVRLGELQVRREDGQGMVEYALILVLVSIVAVVALRVIGVDVDQIFDTTESELETAAG